MKKRQILKSVAALAMISVAAGASAADGDALKYSLGGGLERTPMVSAYDTAYLFDYDEASGEWTRTVTVGATGNNYFSVFNSSGQKWSYEVLAVESDHAAAPLVSPAYGNMEFRTAGVWHDIKLTVTEVEGTPYLKISGFTADTPESKIWSVAGSLSTGGEAWMTDTGNSIFSYTIPEVKKGDSFYIAGPGSDNQDAQYGFGGDPIIPGVTYLLEEGRPAPEFAADYKNVTLQWNALTKRLSFSGDEVYSGVGTLRPTSVSPAQGSTYVPTTPLSRISFTFNQMPDGISTIKREEGLTLKLMRDGLLYLEIPSTDMTAISVNRNNPNQLDINFSGVSEAGVYSLTLPQDFITLSGSGGGVLGPDGDKEEVTDLSKLCNAAYTLEFNISEMLPFTIAPTPGEVKKEDLATLRIRYPEGAVVKQNPAFNSQIMAPAVYYINEAAASGDDGGEQRSTRLTNYSVSMDGNVAVLTALNPSAITDAADNAAVRYMTVSVPKGAWLVDYQGKTETIPGYSFEKYTIAKETQSVDGSVVLTPSASEEFAAEDLQSIKVTYPEGYTFNAWSASNPMGKRVGYIVGYLRKVASATAQEGENIGDYKLADIDTSARTLTLECSSSTSALVDGYYTIMLTTNLFVLPDGSKNASLYFPGYEIGDLGTGVSAPEAESLNAPYNVVLPDGRSLLHGAEELPSLPAGLYIINGRKVMVKK